MNPDDPAVFFVPSPLAKTSVLQGVLLYADEQHLYGVRFVSGDEPEPVSCRKPTTIHQMAKQQLLEYFHHERKIFDLPLSLSGTVFQQQVWQQIAKIPYGQLASYQEIAIAVGDYRKARPVGQAANKNPLPIVVPCHRIVGKNGKLTGFASGLEIKSVLLSHEQS